MHIEGPAKAFSYSAKKATPHPSLSELKQKVSRFSHVRNRPRLSRFRAVRLRRGFQNQSICGQNCPIGCEAGGGEWGRLREGPFPSVFKEGWLRFNKKFPFLSDADGVVSKRSHNLLINIRVRHLIFAGI